MAPVIPEPKAKPKTKNETNKSETKGKSSSTTTSCFWWPIVVLLLVAIPMLQVSFGIAGYTLVGIVSSDVDSTNVNSSTSNLASGRWTQRFHPARYVSFNTIST